MPRPHKIIGWGLVTVFGALLLWFPTQIRWTDWSSAWELFPIAAILAGFVLIPGIMVLKRRWDELAGIISAAICLALFFFFVGHISGIFSTLESASKNNRWLPVLGLLVIIGAWALPIRLHKILKPRLERCMKPGKTEANPS